MPGGSSGGPAAAVACRFTSLRARHRHRRLDPDPVALLRHVRAEAELRRRAAARLPRPRRRRHDRRRHQRVRTDGPQRRRPRPAPRRPRRSRRRPGAAWRLELPPPRSHALAGARVGVWLRRARRAVRAPVPRVGSAASPASSTVATGGPRSRRRTRPSTSPSRSACSSRMITSAISPSMPDEVAEAFTGSHLTWLRLDEAAGRTAGDAGPSGSRRTTCCCARSRRRRRSRTTRTATSSAARSTSTARRAVPRRRRVDRAHRHRRPAVGGAADRPHAAGLPVGVQVVAPYLRDRTVRLAGLIADVAAGYRPPGFGTSRAVTAPHIDLLAADFYVDGAREAYAWMREHAPCHFDEKSGLWGIATYDGVLGGGATRPTFSNAGGSRPDTGPLPWMIDMDAPDHLKRRKLVNRGVHARRGSAPARRAFASHLRRAHRRGVRAGRVRLRARPRRAAADDRHRRHARRPARGPRRRCCAGRTTMLGSLNGEPERIEAAAASFGEYVEYARGLIADRRGAADRRPRQRARARRGRRRPPRRRRDRLRVAAAAPRRRRDDAQRDVRRHGAAARAPRRSSGAASTTAACSRRGRGDAAVGVADQEHEPHGHRVTSSSAGGAQRRRQGAAALRVGELRRGAVRRPGASTSRVRRTTTSRSASARTSASARLARLELRAIFERLLARLPDLELAGGRAIRTATDRGSRPCPCASLRRPGQLQVDGLTWSTYG